MKVTISCPECEKTYQLPEEHLGRKVRCAGCGEVFVASTPELQPEPVPDDDPIEDENALLPEDRDFVSMLDEEVGIPLARAPREQVTPETTKIFVPKDDPQPRKKTKVPKSKPLEEPDASGFDALFWIFLIALLPLLLHTIFPPDSFQSRLIRTQTETPGAAKMVGAHLVFGSSFHWIYALLSICFFLWVVSELGKKQIKPQFLLLIGAFTGTIGILLLVMIQGMGGTTRGLLMIRNLPLIFFAWISRWTYEAALDPESGFLVSLLGFTFSVGLFEEICKAIPIYYYLYRNKATWRESFLVGLASGIGFAISEGILYSGNIYNGRFGFMTYLVRFTSCVSLHAIWSGSVGLIFYSKRKMIDNELDWEDCVILGLVTLGIPMFLHGLYDTLLKKDYLFYGLLVALISFAYTGFLLKKAAQTNGERLLSFGKQKQS